MPHYTWKSPLLHSSYTVTKDSLVIGSLDFGFWGTVDFKIEKESYTIKHSGFFNAKGKVYSLPSNNVIADVTFSRFKGGASFRWKNQDYHLKYKNIFSRVFTLQGDNGIDWEFKTQLSGGTLFLEEEIEDLMPMFLAIYVNQKIRNQSMVVG